VIAMEKKCLKSEIEVHIQGTNVIINEYYSHGCMEKLLKQAKEEYGLAFIEKCRSRCG